MFFYNKKAFYKISLLFIPLFFSSFLVTNQALTNISSEKNEPIARYGHDMVYDIINNRIIMFGGVLETDDGQYIQTNTTWEYSSKTYSWMQLNTTNSPGKIAHHGMVYDSSRNKIISFGGLTNDGNEINETWIFDCDTNEWNQVFPFVAPHPRADASLIYDNFNDKIILFGGSDYEGFSGIYFDDTWCFDIKSNNWTNLELATHPSGRYGHRMIYEPTEKTTLLYGGRTHSGVRDELWRFNYSNNSWNSVTHEGTNQRYWHMMSYIETNDQIAIYGGRESEYTSTQVLDDAWTYNIKNNKWNNLTSTIYPPSLIYGRMVYDSYNEQLVLFGGTPSILPLTFNRITWIYSFQENQWFELENVPTNFLSTKKVDNSINNSTPAFEMIFLIVPFVFLKINRKENN